MAMNGKANGASGKSGQVPVAPELKYEEIGEAKGRRLFRITEGGSFVCHHVVEGTRTLILYDRSDAIARVLLPNIPFVTAA